MEAFCSDAHVTHMLDTWLWKPPLTSTSPFELWWDVFSMFYCQSNMSLFGIIWCCFDWHFGVGVLTLLELGVYKSSHLETMDQSLNWCCWIRLSVVLCWTLFLCLDVGRLIFHLIQVNHSCGLSFQFFNPRWFLLELVHVDNPPDNCWPVDSLTLDLLIQLNVIRWSTAGSGQVVFKCSMGSDFKHTSTISRCVTYFSRYLFIYLFIIFI